MLLKCIGAYLAYVDKNLPTTCHVVSILSLTDAKRAFSSCHCHRSPGTCRYFIIMDGSSCWKRGSLLYRKISNIVHLTFSDIHMHHFNNGSSKHTVAIGYVSKFLYCAVANPQDCPKHFTPWQTLSIEHHF